MTKAQWAIVLKKVDFKALKEAAKSVGVEMKIGTRREDFINSFLDKIDNLPEAEKKTLGDQVVETYNNIVDILEEAQSGGEEKVEEKPKEEKPPKEVKEKPAKTPKPPKPIHMSRPKSISEALLKLKKGTADELIASADEIYSKDGGKSNIKECRLVFGMVIQTLVGLGTVVVEGEAYRLK